MDLWENLWSSGILTQLIKFWKTAGRMSEIYQKKSFVKQRAKSYESLGEESKMSI